MVLFIGLLLYAFGVWESGRQNLFTGEKGKHFYPTGMEALERAAEEPVLCAPVGEAYLSGEETGIAEGLLAELQEYVSRGEQSEAMAAYRDEALMLDVEDLLKLCPEYESLIEEAQECGTFYLGLDVLQDIIRIYQVPSDEEGSNTLLIQYAGHAADSSYSSLWIFLRETDTGYLAGVAPIGAYSKMGLKEKMSVIFTWEEGGQKAYYLLEKLPARGLYVRRLVLRGDWEERLRSEIFGVFDGDAKYIRRETTRAVPGFYYLNRKSSLLPAVKEYVEENMACFADKLYGWDGNVWRDLTIWGTKSLQRLPKRKSSR